MSPAINRAMTPAEWALLFTLSLLWGASFLFVAVSVKTITPITLVTARMVIAALVLYVIVRAMGTRLPADRRSWRDFLVMGLLNNFIPFSLIAWGQTYIAGGLASILNATSPLFAVVVAHLLTSNERMTPGRVAGVLTGFAGVAIMFGPSLFNGIGGDLLPMLACLGAAFAYALSVVFALRFSRRGIAPLPTATGQMIGASIIMIPIMLIADRPWTLAMPSPTVIGAVVCLGILSTALAYVIYYRILSTAGSVNLTLVTFLMPVTAILLGAIVLGEWLQPRHFIGMAAIGLGLAFIDGRLVKRLRRFVSATESR